MTRQELLTEIGRLPLAEHVELLEVITRNLEDYKNSTPPFFAPSDFLSHLKAQQP